MTRITVTNEVWREFREAARVRGISVTTYLVSGHRLWQRVPPELGRGLAYLH
jgi:sRNA-binding regulator protein Hfq